MSESGEVRMGVSEARANLTEVIAKVRLLGQQVVLTRREKPQAVLVSPDFYEQAKSDREWMTAIQARFAELPEEQQREWGVALLGKLPPFKRES